MTANDPIGAGLGGFDPSTFDFQGILAQAQSLQSQFERGQAELAARDIVGSSGGGLIEATVSGTGELKALSISPQACDPDDTQLLADLIVAAIRDANSRAARVAEATLPPMPGF
ncbi:MAG: YbaB/EbfC family nucleoid-associated protein [Propionibacteriaceae bacterium]|jgi:DNA-binding YbaB/EbfC family protein|nr:YbaB/EbfC family nucleoid-associated protein [Propionibacteriaceae bacterium]